MKVIETHDGLKAVLELDSPEIKWWRKTIGEVRKHTIPSPTKAVDTYFHSLEEHGYANIDVSQISTFIADVREGVWNGFIEKEILFFKEVVGILVKKREVPHEILDAMLTKKMSDRFLTLESRSQLLNLIGDVFQDYTGRIFPYFYELSKSQTNSRRSRAGSEFEAIIDHLMTRLEIPYDSQSHLGQRTFSDKGLGKKVDGVVPSMAAFNENRSRCIIATMKTTIRERWQEVVEELNRTNIPSIHLLTLDTGITENTLTLMKNHNITLVTYKWVKECFPTFTNIMDFETFFGSEIPHTLAWWQKNTPPNAPLT